MKIISQLNRYSKGGHKGLRAISLYNQITFWFTVVVIFVQVYFLIKTMPGNKMTYSLWGLFILVSAIEIAISYLALSVNVKLLKGSKKAYWFLLLLFAIQSIGIHVSGCPFDLQFGIPVYGNFGHGAASAKVNVITLLFTTYLISMKKEIQELLEKQKLAGIPAEQQAEASGK